MWNRQPIRRRVFHSVMKLFAVLVFSQLWVVLDKAYRLAGSVGISAEIQTAICASYDPIEHVNRFLECVQKSILIIFFKSVQWICL